MPWQMPLLPLFGPAGCMPGRETASLAPVDAAAEHFFSRASAAQDTPRPPAAAISPLRGSRQHGSAGIAAVSLPHSSRALPGTDLVQQARTLLHQQLVGQYDASAVPDSSSATVSMDAPDAEDQAAPSSTAACPTMNSEQHRQLHLRTHHHHHHHQQQQQQQALAEAVRNANAAWTAATWRLISGQQPQP